MTDLIEIKSAFADDPVSLLDELGVEYSVRSGRISVLCPFHADTHLGNATISNGYFHCFACNTHADVFEFIKQEKGCNFRTAVRLACQIYGLQYDDEVRFNINKLTLSSVERQALALPQTALSINRLTESDRKIIYLRRADEMIGKYEKIIELYGDADATDAWKLAELADANTVTFSRIKRNAESRIKILQNLKSRIKNY